MSNRNEMVKKFVDEVDWNSYDYTAEPGADMNFSDFPEDDDSDRPIWVSKHYNTTGHWNCVHVCDLNQIKSGAYRKMLALYGVPVSWPSKDEDEDVLEEVIETIDDAREEGGDAYAEALDQHGLLNDEHYVWLRGYKLGRPEAFEDYDTAKDAIDKIEAAKADEDEDLDDVLDEFEIKDEIHYEYLKKEIEQAEKRTYAAYNAVLTQTHAFLQDRFEKHKEALSDELSPYKGMSMEQWASINAQLSQGEDLNALISGAGLEAPEWDDINTEWNERMSRDSTATIATVYGQAFTGGGQGQFGAAAEAVSASMASGSGSDVTGEDPISFEDWVKITEHMNAGAAQGMDSSAILGQYNLNPADWGTIGGYWGQKMNANPMQYIGDYQKFQEKYSQQFTAAGSHADVEF